MAMTHFVLRGLLPIVFLIATTVCSAKELPNIILCMGDDHGWEETGYNGHPHVKTPVLDEMAATGLRLDRFHSGHPSCSPTRGSFLTGRHPNRYGTFTPGWSLRPEEITLAHLAKKAGYATGHFGKWHVGTVKKGSPTNPGAMGFDEWFSHDNFFELNPHLSRNGGEPKEYKGESSEIIIDETIQFVNRSKDKKKPFLAVVWFGSPHEPYSGLPKDLALYDDLPKEYEKKLVRLTSNETGLQVKRPLRAVLRERFAEITAMDRAIGNLRNHLSKSGLKDNTLLFYCGDNGTPSSGIVASPFRGMKGDMYEGGTRVPGVIEWPAGVPKPAASQLRSTTSDLLPTVCDLVGVGLPERPMDGMSLLPMMQGKMKRRPGPLFFWSYDAKREIKEDRKPYIDPELQRGTTPFVKLSGGIPTRNFRNFVHPTIRPVDYDGHRVILDDEYKLVIHGSVSAPKKLELFDLESDPAEKENLAKSHPSLVKQMNERLTQWQSSVLSSLTGKDYK